MDVTSTPTTTTPRAPVEADAADKTAKSALNSDFETFLKMLTTQMQNQDPLNPMESTEFATQLATFSSVEQQTRTNDLLTAMSTQIGVMGISQMASWVGMEARTSGPTHVDGAPVALTPQPAPGADTMAIVVRNAAGQEVARESLVASDDAISWAPVGSDGKILPKGDYTFELVSLAGGATLDTSPMDVYSRIIEAQSADGKTQLVLSGGAKVAPEEITALRQPGA